MSLSAQVGRSTEKYLFDRIVAGGYPPKNYRVEYEFVSDNSIQVILTVARGLMGFFSSGKTLINEIMGNEKAFKAELQKFLEKSFPQYNIYLSDIITMSNQTAIFTISYYPRAELPPDMIRKILSYLPPEEIERISKVFPGQEGAAEDQYLWHMMVMNNFWRNYPLLEEIPLGSVMWKELYQELDAFRRAGIPLAFDNKMFKLAVMNDFMELVLIMLQDSLIDPNDQTDDSPLSLAVSGNKLAITEILLKDPRVDVDPLSLLQTVINQENPIMARLISRYIEPNMVALSMAIYGGDQERFEQLLGEIDPNGDWTSPVISAVMANRPDFLRRLLQSPQVDPSLQNDTLLLSAILKGYPEIVRLLLQDPRVNPAVLNNTPVLLAAKNQTPEVLQLLLSDPRVNPLQDFPSIMNLALQTWNEAEKTTENLGRTKATFKVLISDPRIKQAVQELSFLERTTYSMLGHPGNT